MSISTGKAARQRHGTRFAAKRAKARTAKQKRFGTLPVSVKKGNADEWVRAHSVELEPMEEDYDGYDVG